uniref:Uncharacterized protein n=1 Tax=Arundo donax TaxID=35708 RepID=A0A0A8XS80_ARUDO
MSSRWLMQTISSGFSNSSRQTFCWSILIR